MIYSIIAVCIISGVVGVKKPIYGGLAGLVLFPLLHCIFFTFDWVIFLILIPTGFALGLTLASILNRLFFFDDNAQSSKPYYSAMPGGKGGSLSGGIIYTDEERKNAEANENRLREKP